MENASEQGAGPAVGAIVLCGGGSRRMGRAKEWLPFGDEFLLQRVVRLAGTVGRPVVVAARAGQSLPALSSDVGVVLDAPGHVGPLAGLSAGFAALEGAREAAVVVSCDVPLVRPALLCALVTLLNNCRGVVPEHKGRLQPTVAVYRLSATQQLTALLARGERRMRAFVAACDARIVPAGDLRDVDPHLLSFKNVNTHEDYVEAVRLARLDGV